MEITCICGEADALRGEPNHDAIELTCDTCGRSWTRDLSERCSRCAGSDLQTVPLAIVEKGRGTQLSVVGIRPVTLCSVCDRNRLREYHDNRPNPLMPDELPTVAPEDRLT